jgi:CSLREA domain-containing protein
LRAVPASTDSSRRGSRAGAIVAALVCALIALTAVPAFAGAATFEVDSTADAPDATPGSPTCETASGECTLRAAIEAADANLGLDSIHFDHTKFDGSTGSATIAIGSPLPPITEAAEVDGGRCLTEFGTTGPCAEVTGLAAGSGQDVFRVEANATTIKNLAIGGGENGIVVVHQATGFTATGNWLGVDLDGSADGSAASGILLGPGSAGATIGGDDEPDRNVFGFSEIGVNVHGAVGPSLRGNYIGVGPDGSSPTALSVGVMIGDAEGSPGWQAEGAEVGGILTPSEAASTVCDGPCNVIATEAGGIGIDLAGEGTAAATGPTTIRGNYVGLAADGVTTFGESQFGVFAGAPGGCGEGPGDVTVGGGAPAETNYIDGGFYGIYAEGAENFRALGNAIGIAADGTAGESPLFAGIAICAEGVTSRAQVSANEMIIGPEHSVGIESDFGKADITENSIRGGEFGIRTGGESESSGDLIQGNTVTDAALTGIQVTNESNVLLGNHVRGALGGGIELEDDDRNRVGGDVAGEENVIDRSGTGAILIKGPEATRDEVAGNVGSGNAGAFIQLIGDESGELPNGGIEPPTLGTVLQSSATGRAEPNATLRIFRKAVPEAGELESLLAVVNADASGNWAATYPPVPVGTLVAATQTSDGGTSEVSTPPAGAGPDPVKPEGGAVPGGSPPPGPASVQHGRRHPKAPKVKIAAHPAKHSRSSTARFRFRARPASRARFQCRLDARKFRRCRSPRTYRNLKPGKHTFRVRAKASGLIGPVTKYRFTVEG